MKNNIPAVSIIIPMYNAEKYIGDCLDSILTQTFTDYEVIVVDDASTDKSREIVKSYLPKFNGGGVEKLTLICAEKNSGCPGVPRNLGMKLSRGKYLFFIDCDDAVTDTALEELFNIAEKLDADVVECESFYNVPNGFWHARNENADAFKVKRTYKKVSEPTLLSADLNERIIDFMNRRFAYPLWTKLIKRDFLIKNNLEMIDSISGNDDSILTCCILCLAPKYALVPNVVNFYRVREDSISHNNDSIQKMFHKHLTGIVKGFAYLEDFFSNTYLLSQRSDVKFMAIGFLLNEGFFYLSKFFLQIPTYQLYELILSELSGIKDKTAFTAYLLSKINVFYLQLNQAQQIIYQKDAQIQDLQNQLEKARDDTSKI